MLGSARAGWGVGRKQAWRGLGSHPQRLNLPDSHRDGDSFSIQAEGLASPVSTLGGFRCFQGGGRAWPSLLLLLQDWEEKGTQPRGDPE